jgi:beta-N-acetylhexosaminidase
VTRDGASASLSKKWITDILRRRIGYPGLVASDDLEMGGVLQAAPIEEAAAKFVSAGGDLCFICHQQEYVESAFENLIRTAERDSRFRRRVVESRKRIEACKRRAVEFKRPTTPPPPEKISRLATQLWEFSEQVRLGQLLASSAGATR